MERQFAKIWDQPIRWPDDQVFDPRWFWEKWVFFASATQQLQPHAPGDVADCRNWACERLVEAVVDGNVQIKLASPASGHCLDIPGHHLRAPEVAADYVRECGDGDSAWLFICAADLNALIRKASGLAANRGPQSGIPRTASSATRAAEEARAEHELTALARASGNCLQNLPKRGPWIEDSGLGPTRGKSVWDKVAKNYPYLSSKSKPRVKRIG